ncbi:MAG: RsmB/NOP family class I SAM-dependent RNA methyltransferase [Candidatus Saccharimonadales bacterium]
MKKATSAQRYVTKRDQWIERSARALSKSTNDTVQLLTLPRQPSMRLNRLCYKSTDRVIGQLKSLGWIGKPYDWLPDCYTIETCYDAINHSELITSGQVYLQNASSWLPVMALTPAAGEHILDVCAAPGGKAAHIAALTNNQVVLSVNDSARMRLAKMRANFERMQVTYANMYLFDATRLSVKLAPMQFDKILLDAPCSGEGMMQLQRQHAFDGWSVAHIRRLQQVQRRLIVSTWQLLRPGGTLVYSTCTMAPEENELVVDYLLRKQPSACLENIDLSPPNRVPAVVQWNEKSLNPALASCLRLAPSPHFEAFFVAKITKNSEPEYAFKLNQ